MRYKSAVKMTVGVLSAAVVALSFGPAARGQDSARGAQTRPARITQPLDESNRVAVAGSVHPLARAQSDLGAAPDSQPIRRAMLLLKRAPEQEAALRNLLDGQQTKSSLSYRQWVTPQQFGQQFGPADADIQSVTSWLTRHGLSVNRVSAGRNVIEFSGTAGQVRDAFHTEIHRYIVNGRERMANSTPVQIPAALAPVVAGTVSLHNFEKKPQSHVVGLFSKNKATGMVRPLPALLPRQAGAGASATPTFTLSSPGCPITVGNAATCFAIGPADFATIYNVPATVNGVGAGTGQTIAIIGDSQICTRNSVDFGNSYTGPLGNQVTCSSDDVATFRNLFGLPVNAPNVIVDGPDPGFNGDETEGDLDVEWAGAVAPNATIDLVIAEQTEATAGIDLASEYVVENNLAPVLSESFGSCEAFGGNGFYSALWEQAAAQGITVIVSAGDNGSAGCDDENSQITSTNGANVNAIASTPFNVATGGTDFNYALPNYAATYWNATNAGTTQASAKSYIPETTWNDSCAQSLTGALTGCTPISNFNLLNIVAGSGGQSNCINPSTSGQNITCEPIATGSNVFGYPKPVWQPIASANGLTAITDNTRDLPDIALFASDGPSSGSFYVVCEQDFDLNDVPCSLSNALTTFVGVGGTSSSAPTFAGMMALVNQKTSALTTPITRQGNANYTLYSLAQSGINCVSGSSPSASCTFYDVTQGNISVPCVGMSLNCSSTANQGIYGLLEQVNLTTGAPNGALAFNSGTGYDLATGLGSVNATNLVNNWATKAGSFTPTTTAFCLYVPPAAPCSPSSPVAITLTHGATVGGTITVSANVTSSLTKPEDAALIGVFSPGVTKAADQFDANSGNGNIYPLTGGTISGAALTRELVGGTYTLHAHYAGDGTNGSSDSPAISVTVTPEGSATAVHVLDPNTTAAVSSEPYGTLDLVRVDVAGTASGFATATGAIMLTDNCGAIMNPNGALSSAPLNLNSEGYLEDQTAFLTVGAHSFVATYGGDVSYSASAASAAAPFTVTQAATTTTAQTGTSSTPGSVTLTAFVDTSYLNSQRQTAGSFGSAPTGMVTFKSGSTTLTPAAVCMATVDSNGFSACQASLTAALAAGAAITAVYMGDANYAASTSGSVTPNVTLSDPNDAGVRSNPALSVVPGKTVQTTVTVHSLNGFSGSVSLSCVITPLVSNAVFEAPTCAPSPATAAVTAATPGTATFTVSTTAFVSAQALGSAGTATARNGVQWSLAATASLLAFAFLLAMPEGRRRGGLWLVLLAALLATGAVACGGGPVTGGTTPTGGGANPSANPGTTPGPYLVTITPTPGGSAQSISIVVNVQ